MTYDVLDPQVERRVRFSGRVGLAVFVVACLFSLCSLAFAQADPHAGDAFLQLLDTKRYGEAWDASSDFLKQSVSRGEWTDQMVRTRDTIGELASRTMTESKPEKDPQGAPPGDYLLLTYQTVFASQGRAFTETLPMIKGPDGRYRAVGYFLR